MTDRPTASIFDDLFRSPAGIALFSEERMLQSMLTFEDALAKVQAKAGMIPEDAAVAIAACCTVAHLDREALAKGVRASGNPAIPVVKQLTRAVVLQSPDASGFVHWGVTSQDVMDTALVLQIRDEITVMDGLLQRIVNSSPGLRKHTATPVIIGRTWLQHAVPVTFGVKVAGWLDAMLRHRERLTELTPRVLVLQLGGAAGTLVSMDGHGLAIAEALGRELELGVPAVPWHGP